MDFHGFSWILASKSMDFHGFRRISMDFHVFPWISIDFHDFPWISMDLDFGLWTLDFGLWTSDFGLWTLAGRPAGEVIPLDLQTFGDFRRFLLREN